MQLFLKAGNVHVKPKNFRGEWMLAGKLLRTLDTALPRGDGHRAIIIAVRNWSNPVREILRPA